MMVISEGKYKKYIQSLFEKAREKNHLEFIYTLLRVKGVSYGHIDPLVGLEDSLKNFNVDIPLSAFNNISQLKKNISIYHSVIDIREPYKIIANLLRCIQGLPYNPDPFRHLWRGSFPDFKLPNGLIMVNELRTHASKMKESYLNTIFDSFLDEEILQVNMETSLKITDKRIAKQTESKEILFSEMKSTFLNCLNFYKTFIDIYKKMRLSYRRAPRLFKLPNFEVLELLVNDDCGLYGFRVYFSNGSHASYERHEDSSNPLNITLSGEEINFFIGDISSLRKEWMIGDKKLYEVGLPGKYNHRGVWKPIVFPGNTDHFNQEINNLTTDERVKGILFYMMCTGYRVIEFAIKATVELPSEELILPPGIHLWKCRKTDSKDIIGANIWIYDGWLNLEDHTIDTIKKGLIEINRAMNRLSFVYDCEVRWQLKYSTIIHSKSVATPSFKDLKLLEKILQSPFSEKALKFIDSAIDWYKRGLASDNIFNEYLCYWIAMEGLAIALFDGHFDEYIPFRFTEEERKIETGKTIDCIENYLEKVYKKDPVDFVIEAYFNCVKSLRFKTSASLNKVFGPKHNYLRKLYNKRNGYSLEDIRHKIAHGNISGWNFEHEDLVRERIGSLQQISKDFLFRMFLCLSPNQNIPDWSSLFKVSLPTDDPRSTLVVSKEDIIPDSDWKIKHEWID